MCAYIEYEIVVKYVLNIVEVLLNNNVIDAYTCSTSSSTPEVSFVSNPNDRMLAPNAITIQVSTEAESKELE